MKKKLFNLICELSNIKKKLIQEKIRKRSKKSEIKRLCFSNLKAKKLLNLKPIYSNNQGFKITLKKIINWYLENKNEMEKSRLYNI